MESKTMKLWSLTCFIAALPALIVTDWYLKGYGLLVLFILMAVVYGNHLNLAFGITAAALMIGLGLVLDQVARSRYRYHKTEQRGEGQTI